MRSARPEPVQARPHSGFELDLRACTPIILIYIICTPRACACSIIHQVYCKWHGTHKSVRGVTTTLIIDDAAKVSTNLTSVLYWPQSCQEIKTCCFE